jgi:hypothetical protein
MSSSVVSLKKQPIRIFYLGKSRDACCQSLCKKHLRFAGSFCFLPSTSEKGLDENLRYAMRTKTQEEVFHLRSQKQEKSDYRLQVLFLQGRKFEKPGTARKFEN